MILLILVLALVLRLINLNQSFWIDEIAQVLESSRSFWQQWNIPIDFHPPLYHYLVYFWLRVGRLEWWLRTTSVISGVLTVYFTYLLAVKVVNKRVASLSALFLAISPFHIYYSQELRPYAFSCLLATVSMYLFSQLLKTNKKWFLPFILVNILGLYSLYFFPFILASQFLILLFTKKEKLFLWLKHTLVFFLFFLPWLPFFINQLQTGREWVKISPVWAEMVSISWTKALPLVFAKFSLGRITFDNKVVYTGLTLILFLIFLYSVFKASQKKRRPFIFFLLFLTVPIFFSFLIHLFLPIISPKRLLLVLPAFYTLLSLGIFSFSGKNRVVVMAIFLLVSLYGLFCQYSNPRFQREQWCQAVSFIEQQVRPDQQVQPAGPAGLVLFEMSPAQAAWNWYQQREVKTALLPRAGEAEFAEKVEALVKDKNQLFVFQYLFELSDPEQQAQVVLTQKGFKQAKVYDFPGVGLIYEYHH